MHTAGIVHFKCLVELHTGTKLLNPEPCWNKIMEEVPFTVHTDCYWDIIDNTTTNNNNKYSSYKHCIVKQICDKNATPVNINVLIIYIYIFIYIDGFRSH